MRCVPFILIMITSCTVKFKTRVDNNNAAIQLFSWSIGATTKGTIAHMHVQTSEQANQVVVSGYISPTSKGLDYLKKQPVSFYHTDETYMNANNEYNGVTLPLHIGWLALERKRQIVNLYEQERRTSIQENKLLKQAEACYRDFSKLHITNHNDYAFSNLDTQVEIKFAGKKFFDRDKVIAEINKKENKLRSKKISHKKPRRQCLLDKNMHTRIDTAYHRVLARQESTVSALPNMQELPFDAKARADAEFMQLAHAFVQLKWTRLLLARALLQLYKPHQLIFNYSIGVKEKLSVTAFPDDRKKNDSHLRYEMLTTSAKHSKKFTLGHIIFDHALKLKGMWLSLKPRGNVPGFAKLTFKACSTPKLQCPAADFH